MCGGKCGGARPSRPRRAAINHFKLFAGTPMRNPFLFFSDTYALYGSFESSVLSSHLTTDSILSSIYSPCSAFHVRNLTGCWFSHVLVVHLSPVLV